MGLLDMGAPAPAGGAGASMGGLLGGGMPPAPQGQGMQMPPEMQQAIEAMKSQSPEQKQAFFQHIAQQIMASDRPQEIKQQGIQLLQQGLGL